MTIFDVLKWLPLANSPAIAAIIADVTSATAASVTDPVTVRGEIVDVYNAVGALQNAMPGTPFIAETHEFMRIAFNIPTTTKGIFHDALVALKGQLSAAPTMAEAESLAEDYLVKAGYSSLSPVFLFLLKLIATALMGLL
jgi:hypothetical protein